MFFAIQQCICKKKLTSKIKQGYKRGHGSHLYQVLCELFVRIRTNSSPGFSTISDQIAMALIIWAS